MIRSLALCFAFIFLVGCGSVSTKSDQFITPLSINTKTKRVNIEETFDMNVSGRTMPVAQAKAITSNIDKYYRQNPKVLVRTRTKTKTVKVEAEAKDCPNLPKVNVNWSKQQWTLFASTVSDIVYCLR